MAPNLPAGRHAANIFSEQQEEYLGDAMAEHGFESPEAQVRLRNILNHSRIELLFLILVVCDMVLKPGQ